MAANEVGSRIRQAREKRQLTQAELAEKAGLPPATISHFETGIRIPGTSTLKKLADALDESLDYLLGRTDQPLGVGPRHDILYRDLHDLSEDSLDVVQGIVEKLKEMDEKKRKDEEQ